MSQFVSKKWTFFASRPKSLLNRAIRNNWYFYADKISKLKATEVLSIGEKGLVSMFLKNKEDKKNYLQVRKDYRTREVEKYFKSFKKIIKNTKLSGKNPLERGIESHQKIGPILFYSLYIEKVLTEESKKLSERKKEERIRLKSLLKQNSEFRDRVVKIQDGHYEKAYRYLKEKFAKIKDIDHYLVEELSANKKINNAELNKRKNFYVLISRRHLDRVYTGQQAIAILKKEKFVKKKTPLIKEFKGFSAYSGKISGEVVIIKKLADFKKNINNKIIVSPMTIPQFTPYLKKIRAIITDEGGLTSHAAIVAREMRKPCVVGTKIATKVLKDGDLVEVDANKGIVKIIKR